MYRKEFLLRAGAIVLSASLAMSSPIAVLAEGNATSDQIESSVVEEVTDSDGVDIVPEDDIAPPEDEKQPDNSEEDKVVSPDVEDSTDETDTTEKQPDNSTDVDTPRDDADDSSVSTPSDADEVEDEELDNDIEVKQFTIKVVDHFGDTAKVRESATLDKGSEYSYSALEDESWIVVGDAAYSGVLSEDLTIDFYYKMSIMPLAAEIEYDLNATVRCTQYADGTLELQGTGIATGTIQNMAEIKTVIIGDGITGIGNSLFGNASYANKRCVNLESVTLSDSCTSIGQWAFQGCTALVELAGSPETIKYNAFAGCVNLKDIDLSQCTSIGSNAFNCSSNGAVPLNIVDLSGITVVEDSLFASKPITSLIGVSNIVKIKESAFSFCHLTEDPGFDSLEEIAASGLQFNDFTTLTLPKCSILVTNSLL